MIILTQVWCLDKPILVQCGGADGSAETYYEKLDVFDGDTVSFQMVAFAVGNGTLSIELTTDANKLLVNSITQRIEFLECKLLQRQLK